MGLCFPAHSSFFLCLSPISLCHPPPPHFSFPASLSLPLSPSFCLCISLSSPFVLSVPLLPMPISLFLSQALSLMSLSNVFPTSPCLPCPPVPVSPHICLSLSVHLQDFLQLPIPEVSPPLDVLLPLVCLPLPRSVRWTWVLAPSLDCGRVGEVTPMMFSEMYREVSLSREARGHLLTWSWPLSLSGSSFPIC